MLEFDRRLGYGGNHGFNPLCSLCGKCAEDELHAWRCTRTIRDAVRLRDGLLSWIEDHLYMGQPKARYLEDEAYDPSCMVVWAMATKTQGFVSDKMGTADRDSLGTEFLLKAVAASARLWQIRGSMDSTRCAPSAVSALRMSCTHEGARERSGTPSDCEMDWSAGSKTTSTWGGLGPPLGG